LTVILIGFALGLHLCFYTQVHSWPLNVGGKPFFAWPTFLVVIMETGLLLGALANLGVAFHLCKLLPHPNTRLIHDRLTDDTFALVFPLGDAADISGKTEWLKAHGAEEIQVMGVETSEPAPAPVEAAHV
jgi:hypothetical protein